MDKTINGNNLNTDGPWIVRIQPSSARYVIFCDIYNILFHMLGVIHLGKKGPNQNQKDGFF